MSDIPRSEYPRPQFVREDWLCLNGEWGFETDQGDSGIHRGLLERELNDKIIVPFCPESKLSGIENHDYYNAVWYRRNVTIPSEWTGKRVLLHFQAVDYDSTVWVNGEEVGRHRGGFSPFSCDISDVASAGEEITIVLRARDDGQKPQPRGKQARDYGPEGAIYVRTTGIWQSVWLEPVPDFSLRRPRITPDLANQTLRLEQPISGNAKGLRLRATLSDGEGEVVAAECSAEFDLSPRLDLTIPDDRLKLWVVGEPHLYDLDIKLIDAAGNTIDKAKSYAGIRGISIDGKAIKINNKTVFQRLVLDQGYYPDGIMTAPSDAALIEDIELSMAAGFNGARLHQKVFEERFLYHADRLGYIVWGEFGDWGCRGDGPLDGEHQKPGPDYITQWLECLERDYSHPSIVGWCPLNETWQTLTDRITACLMTSPVACTWRPRRWMAHAPCSILRDIPTACPKPMSTTVTITHKIPTPSASDTLEWRKAIPTSIAQTAGDYRRAWWGIFIGRFLIAVSPISSANSAAFGGIRMSKRARTPGATASVPATWKNFTTVLRSSAPFCSAMSTCSAIAIPS